MRRILALAIALIGVPALAAASVGNQATVTVTGDVSPTCTMATVSGSTTFTVGGTSLIDSTTGQLKSGLATDGSKTITGSWCNSASTVKVEASPMVTTAFSGTPPTGFTKAVNYTATASGWTGSAVAVTTTGDTTGANPTSNSATGAQANPHASDITLDLSSFQAPGSSTNKLVAGSYSGTITVTLTPGS